MVRFFILLLSIGVYWLPFTSFAEEGKIPHPLYRESENDSTVTFKFRKASQDRLEKIKAKIAEQEKELENQDLSIKKEN